MTQQDKDEAKHIASQYKKYSSEMIAASETIQDLAQMIYECAIRVEGVVTNPYYDVMANEAKREEDLGDALELLNRVLRRADRLKQKFIEARTKAVAQQN